MSPTFHSNPIWTMLLRKSTMRWTPSLKPPRLTLADQMFATPRKATFIENGCTSVVDMGNVLRAAWLILVISRFDQDVILSPRPLLDERSMVMP